MLLTYFKIALRNLRKNKSFTLINLGGLSLGLASVMTLIVLIRQYYTTDDFHVNRSELRYLKSFAPDGGSYRQTVFPLIDEIKRSCPEVAATSHFQQFDGPWLERGNKSAVGTLTSYVDSDFLTMFSFALQEGNASIALKDKYSVVISSALKTQLFGKEDALGQTLNYHDSLRLIVTGVLKEIPSNSTLRPDVLLPVAWLKDNPNFVQGANWYNTFAESYLLVKRGSDPEALNQKIDRIVKKFYAPETKNTVVRALPFARIQEEAGDNVKMVITGAIASAIFILLIVVVNLLNLNAASLFSRSREVAIRRMIGSGKKGILAQFCIENGLLTGVALLIGFYLANTIFLPQVNKIIEGQMGALQFNWGRDYPLAFVFLGIAVFITLLAGGIPAGSLNALKVTDAIKGRWSAHTGHKGMRNIFITVQFALAALFICITLILGNQIRFMKTADLGYNKEEIVVVNLDLAFKQRKMAAARMDLLLAGLKNDAAVKSASVSMIIPTDYWSDYNIFVDPANKEVHIRQAPAGAGFADTYQLQIKEGRNFDDAVSATESDKVLVNETTVKAFGWKNPVGMRIKGKGDSSYKTVIGVMKDFHYGSLQQPIEPLLHSYVGKLELGNMRYLSIRTEPRQAGRVLASLEKAFAEMPSRRSFGYHTMRELVEDQYSLLDGILRVTNYVGLFTILISCMGMLGLITQFARRRVKEIGIRKVLGAGVAGITILLAKDFLKLVLLAVLVAIPVAGWVMHSWMENFAYRAPVGWWIFALAGLIVLLLTVLAVSYQTLKAATANPVKSLRVQ